MSEEQRLTAYFLRRALELLEEAKREADPVRKLDLEARCIRYWQAAQTGG